MKKGLLRFGVAVLIVLALVFAADRVIGRVMNNLLPMISNHGDSGKTYFSLHDVNTPIVIVGSSRAAHHYVTEMIEDSLKMPAYNVAIDGCFFSYNCCVINSILERYSPKLIIWENGNEYLYDGIADPLEALYPYYTKNEWVLRTIQEEKPWTEYVRLNSDIYRYNSKIHRILIRYMTRHSFVDGTIKGYEPSPKKQLKKQLELEKETVESTSLSETKIERFRYTLERAQKMGVCIVVVDSPKYLLRSYDNISASKMQELCNQFGALYLDNSQLPYFLEHPELFNDSVHLNDDGAKLYTSLFLNTIKHFMSDSIPNNKPFEKRPCSVN